MLSSTEKEFNEQCNPPALLQEASVSSTTSPPVLGDASVAASHLKNELKSIEPCINRANKCEDSNESDHCSRSRSSTKRNREERSLSPSDSSTSRERKYSHRYRRRKRYKRSRSRSRSIHRSRRHHRYRHSRRRKSSPERVCRNCDSHRSNNSSTKKDSKRALVSVATKCSNTDISLHPGSVMQEMEEDLLTQKDGSAKSEETAVQASLRESSLHISKLSDLKNLEMLLQADQVNPWAAALLAILRSAVTLNYQPVDLMRFIPCLSGSVPARPSQSSTAGNAHNILRQARRLYIGSIPSGIEEPTLIALLNSEMRCQGLSQDIGDAVISAQVNNERNFAFIELRSLEDTTAALNLDGIVCLGQRLKIRRPRDYIPPNLSQVYGSTIPSTNTLIIGSIPSFLTEVHLRNILNTLGPLRTLNFVKDPVSGASKGYAFCEYMNAAVTDQAVASLHNLPLREGKLFVARADTVYIDGQFVGAQPAAHATPADVVTLSQPDNWSDKVIPVVQLPVPAGSPGETSLLGLPQTLERPTEVLCLTNMFTAAEIANPDDYTDVLEDIRTECRRFGSVLSVFMPRPVGAANVPGLGKVFVEFASIEEAQNAKFGLSGRKFDGRTVVASFYDLRNYLQRIF